MKKINSPFLLSFLFFLLIPLIIPLSAQGGYCECTIPPRETMWDVRSADECELLCQVGNFPANFTYDKDSGMCECFPSTVHFEANDNNDCSQRCPGEHYFMETAPSCDIQGENLSCQDTTTRQGGTQGCIGHYFCSGQPEEYQCCPPPPPPPPTKIIKGKFVGLPKAKNIPQLIGFGLKVVLGIMGVVAFLMFVYGGIIWLTSGGNLDRIKKARDTLVWATIGLIVIFASYTLVDLIIKTITK